jgi:arylformamidase
MKIIDITQELFSCTVYPGDPIPAFDRVRTMPESLYNLTNISLCVHNGTHADAPRHFIEHGDAIDELPLDIFYGSCKVDALPTSLDCERLLLKGSAVISPELAKEIAASDIRLLGVEGQSVASADNPAEVHQILLDAGVVLLEGLVLSSVKPGEYTLAAFPLKLAGSDGSPVRAVLIKE